MKISKEYAMSSFLIYRQVYEEGISFSENTKPKYFKNEDRKLVYTKNEIFDSIKKTILDLCNDKSKKFALMLSGGIDSAILAALVPEGTQTFTFQPESTKAFSEAEFAKKYAEKNNLKHDVISISWNDYDENMDELMANKGAPIHSIEPQIYKAALVAKSRGFDTLLFGEAADSVFGGLSNLLSRDYTLNEFYKRYAYVQPSDVLINFQEIKEPIMRHVSPNGLVDVHEFLNDVFFRESNASYENACELAGVKFISPYNQLRMGEPLDLERIRRGENKYFLREIFTDLYPDFENREKIPMPRAVDLYFKDWQGPSREEFKESLDINSFSGDQKWLMYCLERFLNNIVDQ